ncbi:MAG: ECF-type sigma factor [Chloroflexota bacterium]
MQTTNWLATLADQSLGDFELSDALDHDLSSIAAGARHNPVERDELFTLLAAKIMRFAARFRYWDLQPWSFDDVLQISYLVYVATIERWRPRDCACAVPRGYLYYFLSVYPLWLSSEVSRLLRRGRPLPASLERLEHEEEVERDQETADLETAAILDDLCRRLTPADARLLRVRVHTGKSIPQAADAVGLARRTAYRRWHNIVEIGREYLQEAS